MEMEQTKTSGKKEIKINLKPVELPAHIKIETQEIKIKKENVKTERVVIVGGGFAGVRAALDLLRAEKNIYITLIDRNLYHPYYPDYYEIASAVTRELRNASSADLLDLKQTAAIPFFKIFGKYKNIEILKDEAIDIDFKKTFVKTKNGRELFYDSLIIAAGSKTSSYNIKNLSTFAFEFKTIDNALNIRNNLHEVFANMPKKENIKIAIGGGGFSGCELAAEIALYIKSLYKIYGRPNKSAKIEIIEASENILPEISIWTRKKVINRLEKLEIKISPNLKITQIEKRKIIFEDKNILEFDMLIWTAGVEAENISKLFPKETVHEKKFYLITDEYLNVLNMKNVFAAGDIAYALDKKNLPAKMTAQTAISEGKYIAKTIKKRLNNKNTAPYKPKQSKFIIPLGGKYAVADLGFIKFSGILAWCLKNIVTLKYFLTILPISKAAALWLHGLRIYIKND